MAAATLDVLWSVMAYERLVMAWDLTPQQATTALTWAIGLVEDAIREGRGTGLARRRVASPARRGPPFR